MRRSRLFAGLKGNQNSAIHPTQPPATGFMLVPLGLVGVGGQALAVADIYEQAFERARAQTRPSLLERARAVIWN
jgi:hypothetical protein